MVMKTYSYHVYQPKAKSKQGRFVDLDSKISIDANRARSKNQKDVNRRPLPGGLVHTASPTCNDGSTTMTTTTTTTTSSSLSDASCGLTAQLFAATHQAILQSQQQQQQQAAAVGSNNNGGNGSSQNQYTFSTFKMKGRAPQPPPKRHLSGIPIPAGIMSQLPPGTTLPLPPAGGYYGHPPLAIRPMLFPDLGMLPPLGMAQTVPGAGSSATNNNSNNNNSNTTAAANATAPFFGAPGLPPLLPSSSVDNQHQQIAMSSSTPPPETPACTVPPTPLMSGMSTPSLCSLKSSPSSSFMWTPNSSTSFAEAATPPPVATSSSLNSQLSAANLMDAFMLTPTDDLLLAGLSSADFAAALSPASSVSADGFDSTPSHDLFASINMFAASQGMPSPASVDSFALTTGATNSMSDPWDDATLYDDKPSSLDDDASVFFDDSIFDSDGLLL